MKSLIKKVFKGLALGLVILIALALVLDLGWIYLPVFQAKKDLPGLETYAKDRTDLALDPGVKILGLGEATHGNQDFHQLRLDLFQKLVKEDGFRTFALEADYAEGLKVNQYILGGPGSIDDVLANFSFAIYKTPEMKALIQWMRNFNQGKDPKDQVHFYGFDFQNPEKAIPLILAYAKDKGLDSLTQLDQDLALFKEDQVKMTDPRMKKARASLNNLAKDPTFKADPLMAKLLENVLASLNYFEKDAQNPARTYEARDKRMADTVTWIQAHEEDLGRGPLFITGHNGHIGRKAQGGYTPMGAHLANQFKNQYFPVGTDYFKTKVNLPSQGSRVVKTFYSADPLAYQAKNYQGAYSLNFKDLAQDEEVKAYIEKPLSMGSLGEGYNLFMGLIPITHRFKAPPKDLYDAMIFFYETQPTKILQNI